MTQDKNGLNFDSPKKFPGNTNGKILKIWVGSGTLLKPRMFGWDVLDTEPINPSP